VSDIYGQLIEHPEYPVEDARHFTITIKAHDFEPRPLRRGERFPDPFCARCGYHRDATVHPKDDLPIPENEQRLLHGDR
jgi:hypothetical protein